MLKKLDGTKIFYTICFLWLVLVDFARGSQDGAIWAMAVNTIGFVMTAVIASGFSWKQEKWAGYLIWSAIWLAGAAAGYLIWYRNPGGIYPGQYITGAMNVWCLGVLGLKLFRERGQLLAGSRKKSILAILWIFLSLYMLISPYRSIWQVWFLVLFGAFYLIPLSKDVTKKMWDGMANGIILGFFCLQIYAFGFRPYDEVRYKGAFGNCNMNALFYLVTYIMFLYRIHDYTMQARERKRQQITPTWKNCLEILFYYVMAGGLLSFTLFTLTRTALLTAAAITLIYGVLTVSVIYRQNIRQLMARFLLIGLCAAVTLPMVYLSIRYLPTILHRPVWYGGEYSENKVHSFDSADSWKYVTLEEFLESAFGRLSIKGNVGSQSSRGVLTVYAAESEVGLLEQDTLLGAEDAENSGKIRMEIYRLYWKNLNLSGHKLTDGFYQITEDYHAWHAQNVFLQIAYYYGIPAGILNVVILIWIGIRSLKLAWNRQDSTNLLPLLVWLLFIGYGLLECVWNPGQMILFLLFFTQKATIKGQKLQ